MNSSEELDPDFVQSVIAHMNSDHADACLCIVKAYSDQTSASHARLYDLDRNSLYFIVESRDTDTDEQAPANIEIKVDFLKPLRDAHQVRGALVGMSKQARDILSN